MQTLDDGYGAVLADGTETRLDFTGFAPTKNFRAIKLRAVIEDDVLGLRIVCCDDLLHC